MKFKKNHFSYLFLFVFYLVKAQIFNFSNETLGKLTPERAFWKVNHYELDIKINIEEKKIEGINKIKLKIINKPTTKLQIDLQAPMQIKKVREDNEELYFYRKDKNAYLVKVPHWKKLKKGHQKEIKIEFEGSPKSAINPPWDGGFVWKKNKDGNPWISLAMQELGASSWFPLKDHQSEEASQGVDLKISLKEDLEVISNGRLISFRKEKGYKTWHWKTHAPINNYNIVFYIGNYEHWKENYKGKKGPLDLNFYVLRGNKEKAKKQFSQVHKLLNCFEDWMGPYPFYKDGYKVVEAPFLGMEHQSAIAYGNGFENGYKGNDLSKSGVGLNFDFILIHESGHEWFGNSITASDTADNWIHEGFTTYAETLYVENTQGKAAAQKYLIGKKYLIKNDIPLIGTYQKRKKGSSDIYEKGAWVIHMIRQMLKSDKKFKNLLRNISKDFYHKIVSSQALEKYICQKTGLPLNGFFDQYLRTPQIPTLIYFIRNKRLYYKWGIINTVANFWMPVCLEVGNKRIWLRPTNDFQSIKWANHEEFEIKNFLVEIKKI